MTLSPAHFRVLRTSALNDKSIETMGCYSVPTAEFERLSSSLQPCESLLAFPYPGVENFCRYRLFPPQGSMKYWQPAGSPLHLYILPSVRSILSNPNVEIAITEGEKKAACLTQYGIPTIGIAGVWNWLITGTCELLLEFDQVTFVDRSILIIFDSNAWRKEKEDIGRALYALGRAVEARGGKVEAVIIPPTGDGKDQGADDFISADGIGKFKELKRIQLRHDGLAQHKPWWEKWRERKSKAEREINKLAAQLVPVEPWPDPVDGADLLDEMCATFRRFVVTVSAEATVVESLWILFTHAIDAFGIAPILLFWSPVPECGKTVNQSIVGRLVPKPLEGSSLTEAVVFRVVEKFRPTLLVDEAADILAGRPELTSLLRAAHQKNKAFVYRTTGESHDVTSFSTWAPKSLAITKNKIEAALASRCLIIRMHRKRRSEKTERFASMKEYPELDVLRRKAAKWTQDNLAAIRDALPQNIPDIENRSLDNYEPLFKIAHVVGGKWRQLINDAAVKILGGDNPVQQSRSIELLKDIKSIFEGDPETGVTGCDRITSGGLVKALVAKEDCPWSEYNPGKAITQNQVGRLLKDFTVYSRNIRVHEDDGQNDKILKGYYARQFKDAFERYIPQGASITEGEPLHCYITNEAGNLGQTSEPLQGGAVAVGESDLSTKKDRQYYGVAVENSEMEGKDLFSPNQGSGFDPNYPFAGETVDEFWTRAEHAVRRAKDTNGVMITSKDVLDVFRGARVVETLGHCMHCTGNHIPEWRRGGKIVERVWPDGRRDWGCLHCGRETSRTQQRQQ